MQQNIHIEIESKQIDMIYDHPQEVQIVVPKIYRLFLFKCPSARTGKLTAGIYP